MRNPQGRPVGRPKSSVEPVSPPADGLGERERRRDDVEQEPDGEASAARHGDADEDPRQQATGDPEPSLPDGEHVQPPAPEQLRVGDHVVGAGADQSSRKRPCGQGRDVGPVPTAGLPPAAGQRDGSRGTKGDHDAVEPELEAAEVQGVEGR